MRAWFQRASELACALALVATVGWAAHLVWVPMRVAGMSMQPTLTAGDLVLVRTDLRPSLRSIVLVREPGHAAMLHRVVALNPDGTYRTRGDANPVDDIEPASPAAVQGTVVAVAPVGSFIQRWRHRSTVR